MVIRRVYLSHERNTDYAILRAVKNIEYKDSPLHGFLGGVHNRLIFDFFNDFDHDMMQKIIKPGWLHEAVSGGLCHFTGCFGM